MTTISVIRFLVTCSCLCLCGVYQVARGQNQSIADSLTQRYESGDFLVGEEAELLKNLADFHTDPQEKLFYSEKLLEMGEASDNSDLLFAGYLRKGITLRMMGNIPVALNNFFEALEVASIHEENELLGIINVNIAGAYSVIGNHSLAINYYNKGIPLLKEYADDEVYSSALFNLGDVYYSSGNLDSALFFYKEAQPYFIELDHRMGLAYILGNTGQVYLDKRQYEPAEINLKQAIQKLTPLGDYYGMSVYLLSLSEIYLARNQDLIALQHAARSLQLAEEYGLKEQIRDANQRLSEIYEKMGDLPQSMSYRKVYDIYKDSIQNLAVVQEMAELRTQFEIAQKQSEVDLLTKEAEIADLQGRRQRWVILGTVLSLILVAVLAISAFRRYRFVQATNLIIEEEKNRSEDLLLNILPEETALELKQKGKVKARKIEAVSVLFTDFIGFSLLAEQVAPEQMVRSIDYYFKQFDDIITRYKLEKIKTIGDSYMCAGGLHSESSQTNEILMAAMEMIEVTKNNKNSEGDLINFDMRIGVHTGPVVAGIVGTKKWQYDIWGDTVNIASRMESNSMSNKVNISESTYQEVKDEFEVEYRGEVEIKNHGAVKMYFLI